MLAWSPVRVGYIYVGLPKPQTERGDGVHAVYKRLH